MPLGWLFIKHLPDVGALLSPAAGSVESCSQEPRQDGHGLAPPGAALLQPSQTQGAAACFAQHTHQISLLVYRSMSQILLQH